MFRIIPHRAFSEPHVACGTPEMSGHSAAVTLRVEGLLCSACAARVRRHLEAVDGVDIAEVSLQKGEARVSYDPSRIQAPELAAAVERAVLLRPARRLLASLARPFRKHR